MAMERYHDELFQAMCREPPPNCLCISMAQVKEADKQLFMRISELTKGALSLRPDGSMPFEGHLGTVKDSAHIQFFMIPQPRPGRFAPYTPPKGPGKGRGKGRKGKGEHAGKSDPSKPSIDIPEGCSTVLRSQHPASPFVSNSIVMGVGSRRLASVAAVACTFVGAASKSTPSPSAQ